MSSNARRTVLLLSSAVLVAAALVAGRAPAQEDGWDPALAAAVSGRWTLSTSEEDARAAIDEGIAAAVAGMPPLVDSIAAGRLRERLVAWPSITIAVGRDRITSTFPHTSYETVPGLTGSYPTPGDPSEPMEVVQLLRGGRFEQIFTTEGGRRWSTYTPSADGRTLTMDAVVRSDRLSADVRFRLIYRRAD